MKFERSLQAMPSLHRHTVVRHLNKLDMNYYILTVTAILLVFSNCSDPTKDDSNPIIHSNKLPVNNNNNSVTIKQLKNIERDSIHLDSIMINNSFPLKLTISGLINELGMPDSVITEAWPCGNYINSEQTPEIYYYGHSRFIVVDNKAILEEMDFRDSLLTFDFYDYSITGTIDSIRIKKLLPNSWINQVTRLKNETDKKLRVDMITNPQYEEQGFFFILNDKYEIIKVRLWVFIC